MTYQDLLRAANGDADRAHRLAKLALLPSTCLPGRDDYRQVREALQGSPPDAIPGWLYSVRLRVLKRWSTRAAHEGLPRAQRLTGPRLAEWRTQRSGKRRSFTFHGWTWTVPAIVGRCIVPAHVCLADWHAWSSGPLVVSIKHGIGQNEGPLYIDATEDEKRLPWADCREARTKLARACDEPRFYRANFEAGAP